jgi:acyl-CoA thioesterase II
VSESPIESAWPRYPGYQITATPFVGVGRVRVGGLLVAESDRCLVVAESDHVDQLYIPVADVRWDLLRSTDHRTVCPFKGEASYWSVDVPGTDPVENVAWGYEDPFDEVAAIRDHVAFYANRAEVTLTEQWSGDVRDHITKRFPLWGSADDLLTLMDVRPVDEHRFTAPPYPDPPYGTFFEGATKLTERNVIEGGQLLGTIVAAAAKTDPAKRVSSAYAQFIRAASFHEPLDVDVEVLRSGRTITSVHVKLSQGGSLCCAGMALLDAGSEDVLRSAVALPEVAGPYDSPSLDMSVEGRDLREVDGSYDARAGEVGPAEVNVWARFRRRPAEQYQHQALLAQATTHWTIAAAMRPQEGMSEADAHVSVSTGPLAVAISFHDEIDVTDWMLYANPAVYAGQGTCEGQGRVHAADGRLLATYQVQAMVRPFVAPPAGMGGYQRAM